jgi:hypothetical protein
VLRGPLSLSIGFFSFSPRIFFFSPFIVEDRIIGIEVENNKMSSTVRFAFGRNGSKEQKYEKELTESS